MKVVKILALLTVAAVVAGCSPTRSTQAVVTVEKPPLVVPDVDNIKLRDVEWHVIGKDNPGAAFAKTKSNSLFAITPKGYENLSLNTAQMTRTIRQLQAQVKAYKDYYQNNNNQKPQEKK